MKIATFNANGIRARMPILLNWMDKVSPDVLCIQETKVQDADFPRQPFEEKGYHCTFKGQKSYNGVAVLSKERPDSVRIGLRAGDPAEEARLITAEFHGVSIVNTYVPQGQDPASDKFNYKIDWLDELLRYFQTRFRPDQHLVWTGDFNVAPEPIDVYDPERLLGSIGFHPKEHQTLGKIKQWGFVDVFRRHCADDKHYTFWDYRIPHSVERGLGWRIDHIWATSCAAERSRRAWIDKPPRLLPKPSDHTFVVAEFEF